MTTQQFHQMVAQKVNRQLAVMADKEANRIVQSLIRQHPPSPQAIADKVRAPRKRRNRNASRRQYAPKGSWLALAPADKTPAAALSGQMASAMDLARLALSEGPAERGVLTQLLVDANPGWTRVTASGCISRLVAGGRMVVVAPRVPTAH